MGMVTEIKLASEFFEPLRTGRKVQTIRRGYRDYRLGPARFSDDSGQSCYVTITRVNHCRIADLGYEDAVNDGFRSIRELWDAMSSFYQDLSPSDEITVVRVELSEDPGTLAPGTQLYAKLVRDKIPERIERNGEHAVFHTLLPNERRAALNAKLAEEVEELSHARSAAEVLEEASDIYEVLLATLAEESRGAGDLVQHADQKRLERGGFSEGIFLESTYK